MSLEATQKLQVIETIESKPNATNKAIADALQVSPSQVSSIRYWLNKKGISYKEEVSSSIDEINKLTKELNELYSFVSNNFKNVVGEGKKQARRVMTSWIALSKKDYGLKKGTIATLPSNTWAIEDIIYNNISKKFSYLACERNGDVFVDMVSKMNQYGKNNIPHKGNLSDVIYNAKQDEFDHIIADYCGVLSSFKDEIIHACLNKVVKVGGTISVTTLKARNDKEFTSKLNEFYSETITGTKDSPMIDIKDNHQAIRMFFKSLCAITNFEVVEEFCYNDTAPMMLVVLKRIK